jgi:hypothetical protein
MFHELNEKFIYAAHKLTIKFSDGNKEKIITGTGFIIGIGNNIPYLVTNRHLIDLDYNNKTSDYKYYTRISIEVSGRRPDDTEYSYTLSQNANLYYSDKCENDIVLIEFMINANNGKDLKFGHYFNFKYIADEEIYKNILPFDLVCYSGFPITHDKFNKRPILRSGHIASDPKYSYSHNNEDCGDLVAYEGFSSEGASGSPIYAPPRGLVGIPGSRHGYLIGVNAGHIKDIFGHSGISYFYKSTIIFEIIKKINNEIM